MVPITRRASLFLVFLVLKHKIERRTGGGGGGQNKMDRSIKLSKVKSPEKVIGGL